MTTQYEGLRGLILLVSVGVASPIFAQTSTPPAMEKAKAPEFEVVSVKVHRSEDGGSSLSMTSDGYQSTNGMLAYMIMGAYGLNTREMLTGLPGWAEKTHFDVQAKMSPEDAAAFAKLSRKESGKQREALMQSLLADRFALQVHHVVRELPAYALVVAKGGFKLKDADLDHPTVAGLKGRDGISGPGSMTMGLGTFSGQAVELSNLAANLQGWVHRQIIDRTGLKGKYDVSLKWTPDEMQGSGADAAAPPGPSLMTALEEQLGLRLEAIKFATDTIVVDHVQMPSEN